MDANASTRVSAGLADVRRRIDAACARAGRDPGSARLVAVSKGMSTHAIRGAIAAGAREFGENYVQEATAKRDALTDVADVTWHFIGRVQRNKAAVIATFDVVHSIADDRAAAALDAAASRRDAPLPVLVQVNVGGESSKAGVAPAELPRLVAAVRRLPALRLIGLMTLPPPLGPAAVRPLFAALRELRDRQEDAKTLRELSMGMSADFEVAIEEGATLVRVGTAIFGPREGAA